MVGFLSLAFADTLAWVMCSVFLVGIGSSTLHPEASRLTSIASGGKRGQAQSLFQVGGNLGGAIGPLLVSLLAAPYGRRYISFFSILSFIAILVAMPVCRWYKEKLQIFKHENATMKVRTESPLPLKTVIFSISILLLLIFSKYIYMASLSSYYTFYLIEKFNVSVQDSQIYLFVFLGATAIGTLVGGPVGDKIGRKYVIWTSILGAAPFTLLMPHVNLFWTVVMSFFIGLIISSAFPAILLYAQELLPYKLGLVSGLFFGFAFGVAGIASAILGKLADLHGLETIYQICAFMPLLGIITWLLPDLRVKS
jgi:FSR family fosmidomycin resistance protein-like MFS transporter